jgi:hypothetical protein
MANVWYKVQISLESQQDVSIQPDEGFDGIVVETVEIDDKTKHRIYLNKQEMEFLIAKMQEVMNYTISFYI